MAAVVSRHHHMEDPTWCDPIIPRCKICKHVLSNHNECGCHHGLFSKCKCEKFVFDQNLFNNEVNAKMLYEEGWFDRTNPQEEKQLMKMKPLVEKHIRQYEQKAKELSLSTQEDEKK